MDYSVVMGVNLVHLLLFFGITSFIGNNEYMNFYCAVGAVVIGFIGALIATYVLEFHRMQMKG